MLTNKIKALLMLKNSGLTKFADYVQKSQPTISNKAKRDSWTAEDLIKIAAHTNTKLAFLDENNKPLITFEENDLSD